MSGYKRFRECLTLMSHQEQTVQLAMQKNSFFDASSPGVGKTITHLAVWNRRKDSGRLLVLATKSILQAAWGNDIEKFIPDATYAVAWAGKSRENAFKSDADIVITNHDAVKWLLKNKQYTKKFTTLIVDESTAFKNRTSQRSKSIRELRSTFKYRTAVW